MWKTLAVVVIGVVVLAGWLSRAGGQEATPPDTQLPPNAGVGVADSDLPRRAATDFAPWIESIILQQSDKANRRFPLRREAQEAVESQNALRIFREFPKLNGLDISLVGGRTLGEQAGVLLFTVVTEHGVVAFKIYHYKFGSDRYVGKVEITDEWSEIEKMYLTVDALQTPVTVPL